MMFLRKVVNMTEHLRHSDYINIQKNDRQRKIPNLFFWFQTFLQGPIGIAEIRIASVQRPGKLLDVRNDYELPWPVCRVD